MRTSKKGFTLIELLVVIAIIGILATLAVVALQQIRANARDAKRVADVKQISTALELYFNDKQDYPEAISELQTEGYVSQLPEAPTPADGECSQEDNRYYYYKQEDGRSYHLYFCLKGSTGNLPQGSSYITPNGIKNEGSLSRGYCKIFNFDESDGYWPYNNVTISDDTLYGLTYRGGDNDKGVIFKINKDGSNFEKLHDFEDLDGKSPIGKLTIIDDVIYGMTLGGGNDNHGVIFKINKDGSNYTKLHDFNGSDGRQPYFSSLVPLNDYFYGLTLTGGLNDKGVLFRIDKDGSNFTKLFDFSEPNGSLPAGKLYLLNNNLYGMTREGGSNNSGAIFKFNISSNTFTKLYDFNNSSGVNPRGGLTFLDDYFYGTTYGGGNNDKGTIFKIDKDGNNFSKIFDLSDSSGCNPLGNSLIVLNDNLYGMAPYCGDNNKGTIFKIKPDGSNFSKILSFDSINGERPQGDLILSNGFLYGMTIIGGDNNRGVIFRLSL
jgi:prepilin-type N-terminal cleavage/methylation domain-containing protein